MIPTLVRITSAQQLLPPRQTRCLRPAAGLWAGVLLAVTTALLVPTRSPASPSVKITTQTPGATPFISLLSVALDDPAQLDYIAFEVQPKPGSVTRPVAARYSAGYLRGRNDVDPQTGVTTVPVFGLYAGYANTVNLQVHFLNGSTEVLQFTVPTADYKGDLHKHPEVVQARTGDTSLSYDFILLKDAGGAQEPTQNVNSPLILDTDGEIRWVGSAQTAGASSLFYNNGVYVGVGTGILARVELDGSVSNIGDYTALDTVGFHHNIDAGRDGLLLELNTATQTENLIVETDPTTGQILHTWQLSDIISAAMIAGGDDPTQFVKPAPDDWFHNNSATYRASDNTLIVSSRENFVVALDYDTKQIKWILGDTSKSWYQFPSLRQYALTLGPNTKAPIGQHAVSIVRDRLLLFDDGFGSLNQVFAGKSRSYSAARKYLIDSTARTATETWNYTSDKLISSPICSSVYEDQPHNFLIDFATEGLSTMPFVPTDSSSVDLMGLNAAGEKVFDYKYPEYNGCGSGWNAQIVHLENLVFN